MCLLVWGDQTARPRSGTLCSVTTNPSESSGNHLMGVWVLTVWHGSWKCQRGYERKNTYFVYSEFIVISLLCCLMKWLKLAWPHDWIFQWGCSHLTPLPRLQQHWESRLLIPPRQLRDSILKIIEIGVDSKLWIWINYLIEWLCESFIFISIPICVLFLWSDRSQSAES